MKYLFANIADDALAELAPAHWRAKAATMQRVEMQRQELVAGGLLVRMLGFVPHITTDANGKPRLAARNDIFFSIAHSHQVVMCLVAEHPCGCDVEHVRPCDDDVKCAALTPDEITRGNFFDLWTRKEAYLKALGCGLARAPNTFAAASTPARNIPAPPDYAAAICILNERNAIDESPRLDN